MIYPQWLELLTRMSRTNVHGPKNVRAIQVRLYVKMSLHGALAAQWDARPTSDQEIAGSTPDGSATVFRGD